MRDIRRDTEQLIPLAKPLLAGHRCVSRRLRAVTRTRRALASRLTSCHLSSSRHAAFAASASSLVVLPVVTAVVAVVFIAPNVVFFGVGHHVSRRDAPVRRAPAVWTQGTSRRNTQKSRKTTEEKEVKLKTTRPRALIAVKLSGGVRRLAAMASSFWRVCAARPWPCAPLYPTHRHF